MGEQYLQRTVQIQGVPEKTLLKNFWTRDHALHLLADIVVLQAVVNAGAVIPRCPISWSCCGVLTTMSASRWRAWSLVQKFYKSVFSGTPCIWSALEYNLEHLRQLQSNMKQLWDNFEKALRHQFWDDYKTTLINLWDIFEAIWDHMLTTRWLYAERTSDLRAAYGYF